MSETFLIVLAYIALSCLTLLAITVTIGTIAMMVESFRDE